MPFYKILTTSSSRWGEGWKFGDIVEMDDPAAKHPLENGEIELIGETKEPFKEVEEVKETKIYVCEICGKVCKNRIGLAGHMRSHKSTPPSAEEKMNPEPTSPVSENTPSL